MTAITGMSYDGCPANRFRRFGAPSPSAILRGMGGASGRSAFTPGPQAPASRQSKAIRARRRLRARPLVRERFKPAPQRTQTALGNEDGIRQRTNSDRDLVTELSGWASDLPKGEDQPEQEKQPAHRVSRNEEETDHDEGPGRRRTTGRSDEEPPKIEEGQPDLAEAKSQEGASQWRQHDCHDRPGHPQRPRRPTREHETHDRSTEEEQTPDN